MPRLKTQAMFFCNLYFCQHSHNRKGEGLGKPSFNLLNSGTLASTFSLSYLFSIIYSLCKAFSVGTHFEQASIKRGSDVRTVASSHKIFKDLIPKCLFFSSFQCFIFIREFALTLTYLIHVQYFLSMRTSALLFKKEKRARRL
jgi:hypothetical protein